MSGCGNGACGLNLGGPPKKPGEPCCSECAAKDAAKAAAARGRSTSRNPLMKRSRGLVMVAKAPRMLTPMALDATVAHPMAVLSNAGKGPGPWNEPPPEEPPAPPHSHAVPPDPDNRPSAAVRPQYDVPALGHPGVSRPIVALHMKARGLPAQRTGSPKGTRYSDHYSRLLPGWASTDATPVGWTTDAQGDTVEVDAQGRPIPGTVRDANGNPTADHFWTGSVGDTNVIPREGSAARQGGFYGVGKPRLDTQAPSRGLPAQRTGSPKGTRYSDHYSRLLPGWASTDATPVGWTTDAQGDTVEVDAQGRPIPGTVRDANGNPTADHFWTGSVGDTNVIPREGSAARQGGFYGVGKPRLDTQAPSRGLPAQRTGSPKGTRYSDHYSRLLPGWASTDATPVGWTTDAQGDTVEVDAQGRPIPGTVRDANGNPTADHFWTGSVGDTNVIPREGSAARQGGFYGVGKYRPDTQAPSRGLPARMADAPTGGTFRLTDAASPYFPAFRSAGKFAPSRGLLPSGHGMSDAPRGPIPVATVLHRAKGKSYGHPILGMKPSGKGGGGGHGGGGKGHGGHPGHGHHPGHGGHWRGRRGFNGAGWGGWDGWSVWPQDFLYVMGWDPRGWCGMSPQVQLANVMAWNAANPGSIANPAQFIAQMNAYCLSYGSGLSVGPSMGLAPSGDITIPANLGPGDWVPYGTTTGGWAVDDLGNYVSIDANGHPIQGTVRASADPNSTPADDSVLDLGGGLMFVAGSDSGDTGPAGAGQTANQRAASDPNVAAALRDVGTFLTVGGQDVQAIIQANNRAELATINANLQLALQTRHAADGTPLTDAQIAEMTTLQRSGVFATPSQSTISTPVAVTGGAIALAVLLKMLDII